MAKGENLFVPGPNGLFHGSFARHFIHAFYYLSAIKAASVCHLMPAVALLVKFVAVVADYKFQCLVL
jgi:hypothetical protein